MRISDLSSDVCSSDLLDHLAAQTPTSELHSLRLALGGLAADADVVLDLHCDDQSLMHLFLVPAHWPQAAELAADLGCRAVLLAEDSGGDRKSTRLNSSP